MTFNRAMGHRDVNCARKVHAELRDDQKRAVGQGRTGARRWIAAGWVVRFHERRAVIQDTGPHTAASTDHKRHTAEQ